VPTPLQIEFNIFPKNIDKCIYDAYVIVILKINESYEKDITYSVFLKLGYFTHSVKKAPKTTSHNSIGEVNLSDF